MDILTTGTLHSEKNKFLEKLSSNRNELLKTKVSKADKKLEILNFPTSKTEEWKYTRLNKLVKTDFKIGDSLIGGDNLDIQEYKRPYDKESYILVFENGRFNKKQSVIESLEHGIAIEEISQLDKSLDEKVQKHYGTLVSDKDIFGTINSAKFQSLLVVDISKNVELLKPIVIINVITDPNIIALPRFLIFLGENSKSEIIHSFHGNQAKNSFMLDAQEVFLKSGATITYTNLQHSFYQVSSQNFYQEKDSNLNVNTFTFEGELVRNNLSVNIDGEGSETILHGAYFTNKKSHIDNYTFLLQKKSHCFSNEVYKGIIDNQSKIVFNGKVVIKKDAQQVNAFQKNNNILLDDFSSVNSKPQLEIFADDVKCSHGCTVGSFDEAILFYLRSRGISKERAINILISAFYDEVLEPIKKNQTLLKYVLNQISERYNK